MPTTQQTGQPGPGERGGRPPAAALGAHVLSALGRPGGLRRVEVRRLWEGHYRVNVFGRPRSAPTRGVRLGGREEIPKSRQKKNWRRN